MTSGGRHGPAGCRPRWENTAPEDWEVGRYEKNDAVVGPGRTDCARARVARDVESGSGAAQGCHGGRFRGWGPGVVVHPRVGHGSRDLQAARRADAARPAPGASGGGPAASQNGDSRVTRI